MPIIIHAVQKLLNTSRTKAGLFVTAPSEGQELHSWYARLVPTTFVGKLFVMYVHDPSLMLVLTKGKTITGTLPEFYTRLEYLLKRSHFEADFIEREMPMVKDGYVISKTNSKSILGSMNAITTNIKWKCYTYSNFESIDPGEIEDSYMDWLTHDPTKP